MTLIIISCLITFYSVIRLQSKNLENQNLKRQIERQNQIIEGFQVAYDIQLKRYEELMKRWSDLWYNKNIN